MIGAHLRLSRVRLARGSHPSQHRHLAPTYIYCWHIVVKMRVSLARRFSQFIVTGARNHSESTIAGAITVDEDRSSINSASNSVDVYDTKRSGQKGGGFAEPGHLYCVGTPIGNLLDMTPRAISILKTVDVIVVEDTRHAVKLLRYFKIPKTKHVLSHHAHNIESSLPRIRTLLSNPSKKSVALITDAGTPGISDPGQEVVAMCGSMGAPVHPIPGPSACVAALSVAGFVGSEFLFKGFLPLKGKTRAEAIASIVEYRHTVVLYEAPHRMLSTMMDLLAADAGNRRCVCCRELTKLHEEIYRGTVGEYIASIQGPDGPNKLKGEFVVILGPINSVLYSDLPPVQIASSRSEGSSQQLCIDELSKLQGDGVPRSEAVRIVTENGILPKSSVYKLALKMEWG